MSCEQAVQDFLDSGGIIEVIPPGVEGLSGGVSIKTGRYVPGDPDMYGNYLLEALHEIDVILMGG